MSRSISTFCIFPTWLLITSVFSVQAQRKTDYQLYLKSGTILPAENISSYANLRTYGAGGKSLIIIQFEDLPDEQEKAELKLAGIELLDYIPNYAYAATVMGVLNDATLKRFKARSIITLSPEQKMDISLANGIVPAYAEKVSGMVDVWISYAKSFSFEEVTKEFSDQKIEVISSTLKDYQVLEVRVLKVRLNELAAFPFVQYVQVIPAESRPLVDKSRANSRANVLSSNAGAGFNLQGSGVVVGVGDIGSPMTHVDLNGRIINYSSDLNYYHGMAVIGILAGGGIVNEIYKGYSPKSRVLVRESDGIWKRAEADVKNHNMVITSNSYGGSPGMSCPDFGGYTVESYILDKQAFDFPFLQHVFAAGNSGQTNFCSQYPVGFGTVLSSYHSAKNTISVGNTTVSGVLGINSSKGPVKDGRTKPDLAAQGSNVTYTYPGNLYRSGTGTSFAAPAVAGGLSLLYERYRQLHDQADPKNALMKALVCNGADDKGLAGPDYSYGFGTMNLLRSLTMLNENHYFEETIKNEEDRSHSIIVSEQTSQLKIMLYWNDPAGSLYSGKMLVNNLDLSVIDPNGSVVLPRLLNPDNVFESAKTGVDDINNMEQVVIDNPIPGTYVFQVKGKTIPWNDQNYFIAYDAVKVSTTLTYPIGNERLSAGDVVNISWDSYGNTASTFKVQYSANNGASWNTLNDNVASNLRQLQWTIPDFSTGQAQVRVIQNSTGVSSESESFVILGAPVVTLSPVQCEGYISIQWPAVGGATDYEVMKLRGDEMKRVETISALNYTFKGLSKDSTYFISVRARINGNPGKRGLAVSRMPNDGSCQGSISDNDLKLESIVSPAGSGRIGTSTELLASHPVTIRIKNLDDVLSDQPIQIGYSSDEEGSQVYWESVSPSIPQGGFYEHTFLKRADLHQAGTYHFKVYLKYAKDLTGTNRSLIKTFKQLENLPVILPFKDDFENLSRQETIFSTKGLVGADRYDFTNSRTFGRLRTFDSSGVAALEDKAIFLDASQSIESPNTNFFDATFNLSYYRIATDEIKLSFKYLGVGKVWVRGNDRAPWVAAGSEYYSYPLSINITRILSENGMEFTESVQVRWEQTSDRQMTPYSYVYNSDTNMGGYSIDDIQLLKETNDIEVLGVTSIVLSCESSEERQINVLLKNNSPNSLTGILLKMQIDGNLVSDVNVSIDGGATRNYLIYFNFDFSLPGTHTIKVWAEKSGDLNAENNTAQISFTNMVVSNLPYLENFETGQGGWRLGNCVESYYSKSWEFGTPASLKINKAASGTKAWKTNLTGNYNRGVTSYLYSPWFETGALQNPTLSFSLALDVKACQDGLCDLAYVEYFENGTWKKLGVGENGTNWYNKANEGWNIEDFTRWHVSTVPLPKGLGHFRLRFVIKANWGSTGEGIAIDDIHIYDLKHKIYSAGPVSPQIMRNAVNGTDWVDFIEGDQIVASVQANNMDLGNTTVQTNLNQQRVRNSDGQYYLDRNFTIKPVNKTFSEQASVRLYFPDSEVERLVTATGCSGCESPESAYELSVSKYSGTGQSLEDGSLENNYSGKWSFFSSDKVIKVPYDIGYYAEFKTISFSEFWLAKSDLGKAISLPVDLVRFDVKRRNVLDNEQNILLEWETSSEKNFSRFDVELAAGSGAARKNLFSKIAEVKGQGGSTAASRYEYTDFQKEQFEILYYRLKMIDTDNTFKYSAIRPVSPVGNPGPRLYPNPSGGVFNLEFYALSNSEATVKIYDMSGRLVKNISYEPKAAIQRQIIDLSSSSFKTGLYLIELTNGHQKKTFKVLKEDID